MNKVYIGGALFSPSERINLESIDSLCKELEFLTYLPHKDGGLFIRDDNNSASFFIADRDNLDTSEIIIAVLNGTDIDSGTSWEIGYAYSKQKTVIGYLEDIRIFNPNRQLNPMILNSLNHLTNNIESLREILKTLK
jgi:nucleoside 2-deoxyribosyltransferase